MLDEQALQHAIEFHGHMCPGLAMGIQVGQIAIKEVGRNTKDNPVRAVVETNLCPVDGVQFTTGCTFGMGAIVYREWGKMGFSFYAVKDRRGVRISPKEDAFAADAEYAEHGALMATVRSGTATPEEQERFRELHESQSRKILEADPYDLYDVAEIEGPAPALIHVHANARCASCGESVAEELTRRQGGRTLCIPCFETALVSA